MHQRCPSLGLPGPSMAHRPFIPQLAPHPLCHRHRCRHPTFGLYAITPPLLPPHPSTPFLPSFWPLLPWPAYPRVDDSPPLPLRSSSEDTRFDNLCLRLHGLHSSIATRHPPSCKEFGCLPDSADTCPCPPTCIDGTCPCPPPSIDVLFHHWTTQMSFFFF